MKLASLRAFELRIPFKAAFKHASAERASTQTLWVEARSHDGLTGFGEGCPREYVTGESLETAGAFVTAHSEVWLAMEWDVAVLSNWTTLNRARIDANPAAWCAVELALLDLLGKTHRRSVEALLGLPELAGKRAYTAVLGSTAPAQFATQLEYYQRAGFREFKIKLAADQTRNRAVVKLLRDAGISPQQARADANNLWPTATAAIAQLQAMDFPWHALEEPLPAGCINEMRTVSRTVGAKIVLDESALRLDQLGALAVDADRWMLNVRISKMGGLLRTLELLREAHRHGLRVVIGAHVGESSVLTRAALTATLAAGNLLAAQEGAFGTHLLAADVVEQPLMFGVGGVLETERFGISGAPGFGLPVLAEPPRRPIRP